MMKIDPFLFPRTLDPSQKKRLSKEHVVEVRGRVGFTSQTCVLSLKSSFSTLTHPYRRQLEPHVKKNLI